MLVEIKRAMIAGKRPLMKGLRFFLLVVIFLPLSFSAWEQPLRRASLEHSPNTYYMAEREKGY